MTDIRIVVLYVSAKMTGHCFLPKVLGLKFWRNALVQVKLRGGTTMVYRWCEI